jgi:hypothetical protein
MLQNVFAFWQPLLSFALPLFLALPSARLSVPLRGALLLTLLGLAMVPVSGITPATYVRSVFDDLALTTTLALLLGTAVRMGWMKRPEEAQLTGMLWMFAAMTLVLYPATLGLTYLDPYRLGYAPRLLLAMLGASDPRAAVAAPLPGHRDAVRGHTGVHAGTESVHQLLGLSDRPRAGHLLPGGPAAPPLAHRHSRTLSVSMKRDAS